MILCDLLKYKISRLFKSPSSVGMGPPNEFCPSVHIEEERINHLR